MIIYPGRELLKTTEQEVYEVEKHIHGREVLFGAGAVEDTLTPYTAISGNGVFGSELLLLDTGDTPVIAGSLFFDPHTLSFSDSDQTTDYIIRVIWGTGTVGDAETAKQYSTVPFRKIISTGNANGMLVSTRAPRVAINTKIWVKIKNATNLAELFLFLGIHEYFR